MPWPLLEYLKAFLTWYQVDFPKTHSIPELRDLAKQADPALASDLQESDALTPYGVDMRYPGDVPEPDRKKAREALELARKVRDAVLDHLEEIA